MGIRRGSITTKIVSDGLAFNFDIDNNEIKKLMNNNLPISNYFKIYKSIDDLIFSDTISFFSDLNSTDIFLKPKLVNNRKNKTRKKNN